MLVPYDVVLIDNLEDVILLLALFESINVFLFDGE
jgi:hypothetical protein